MVAADLSEVMRRLVPAGGMEDPTYFVGRDKDLLTASAFAKGASHERRSGVWLWGARRVGKSSLARALQRQAEATTARVIWRDVIDTKNFDQVLQRVLDEAERILGDNIPGPTLVRRFEQLAERSRKHPVLIILDEVDAFAPNLREEEQKLLRRLHEEHPTFAYCFVSRLPPDKIIEEVSDANSRLLGVLTQQHVKPLRRVDIVALCRLAFANSGLESPALIADAIWQRVGGLSVAAVALLRNAISLASSEQVDFANPGMVADTLEQARSDVREHLKGWWWDLSPKTRSAILQSQTWTLEPPTEFRRWLLEDGFGSQGSVAIPEWLLEIGVDLGLHHPQLSAAPSPETSLQRIHELLGAINHEAKLRSGRDVYSLSSEFLRYTPVTRSIGRESDLSDAIDHLYKILVEAPAEGQGQSRKYRFPSPLDERYRTAQTIGQINDLRNYYRHDFNRPNDTLKPNRDFQAAAEIFLRLCGEKAPHRPEQWETIRSVLLRGINLLLEQMLDEVRRLPSGP